MSELGKIDIPEASQYKNKRKIYFIRNLYLPQNATDEYKDIFQRYWKEADEHLDKLEVAGKISKIFCESIYMTGDEAMRVLNAMNVHLKNIVKTKIQAGGTVLPLENKEIFGSYIDWNNCLMVTRTSAVNNKIKKFLKESIKTRFKHINQVLDENIEDGEAGLLIMRADDLEALKLPKDIELFLVTPPAYDDLLQYIRDSESGTEYWRTT